MPYRLRKKPNHNLFWVVDDTGKKYSKEALPKERAEAQRRALYASESRELKGGITKEEINAEIERARNGSPSAFRYKRVGTEILSRLSKEQEQHRAQLQELLRQLADSEANPFDVFNQVKRVLGMGKGVRGGMDGEKKEMKVAPCEGVWEASGVIKLTKEQFDEIHTAINDEEIPLAELYDRLKATAKMLRTRMERPEDLETLRQAFELINTGKKDRRTIGEIQAKLNDIFERCIAGGGKRVSMSKKAFVKEHKNLLGVLKRGKRSELDAEAKDQAEELKKMTGGCWKCRGGGAMPPRSLLQQIATASYQMNPPTQIGQLELLRATPTLKFYKAPDNTIVVGIRGTQPTDPQDVKADALIGIGQLESAPRYLNDLQTIQQFQTQYPPTQYDYYGVGHSLGGAILDMFLKNGLIKNGVSYNPAVQPQDFQNNSLPNQRIYASNDPLYAIMGRNLSQKPEVRPERQKKWWEKAISAVPYAGKAYNLYTGHQLDQFAGGSKPSNKFMNQLKEVGIEPSLYLKEAQRRAKVAGLPYKLLGFANDDEHKLSIPDADGRMVKFGAVGYGDHLIYTHLEKAGKVPKGTAEEKKDTFQKSHTKIKGDWRKNPFSPNNLALKVLW